MIIKASPSKAVVLRINLVFLGFFLIVYATLLFRNLPSVVINCPPKIEGGMHRKAVSLLENREIPTTLKDLRENGSTMTAMTKREKPSFLNEIGRSGETKIGMVNMEDEDVGEWNLLGQTITVKYEKVSENLEWKHFFPEWIDEEEETGAAPSCPEIPLPPEMTDYPYMDLIVAKLPCNETSQGGWGRDVLRLQIHLVTANLAVMRGKRDWYKKTKVVFLSKCRPMVELFRCNELKKHENDWWFFEADVIKLAQKVSLPVGSCNLALPLWGKDIDKVYDASNLENTAIVAKKEAYATVLHSSQAYVCGAIALAQSLLKTGTKRDLILLLDNSIPKTKREALAKAGWKLRVIKRIRNPRAEKKSYNEYNYSKLRLWQLTDFDKVIFVDSDIIVMRNIDILFHFPEISASGNDGSIFNSGVMVIEPSNCTFNMFMLLANDVVSYNGGDQGFLNEIFVWWHRLPRRVNFLKNFWSNSSKESTLKNQLFGSDPPKLYAIHYLGVKPWLCYRDYDCNWDIGDQRVYASDVAHRTWWKVHDAMDEKLQRFCGLPDWRKIGLDKDRNKARKLGFQDEHWRINITDPRRFN